MYYDGTEKMDENERRKKMREMLRCYVRLVSAVFIFRLRKNDSPPLQCT